jgi:hypothetical protein
LSFSGFQADKTGCGFLLIFVSSDYATRRFALDLRRGERQDGAHSMASIINLNGRASYIHWHFFLMSVPNFIVIVLMLVVFAVALFLRAPGAKRPKKDK